VRVGGRAGGWSGFGFGREGFAALDSEGSFVVLELFLGKGEDLINGFSVLEEGNEEERSTERWSAQQIERGHCKGEGKG
jgi:hypothetical protein